MEHSYSKIKVPFVSNQLTAKKADEFRNKLWNDSIPVDIEYIIDVKLKINIIPSPGPYKVCNTDALISSNWQSLYIDREKYLDERQQNRLRFSLAHEIGHFVLHKEIYQSFKVKDPRDFYQFFERIPEEQYGYLETQANKFANCLLLPRERLLIEKTKILKQIEKKIAGQKIDKKTLNSHIAISIAKIFGVNELPAEIALNDID